jgi:HPt (histidine-containing phosphotransfer) domain-containing protein
MSIGVPVDIAHLSRYTGGDAAVNAEVLTLFADQSVELLARLDTALVQRDSKIWRETTHGLKGGARGIGAFALGDAAQAAEAFDPATDPDAAALGLGRLRASADVTKSFIDAYLGR